MIQRYGFVADFDNETENLVPQESGEWVTHAAHVAELQRWKDALRDMVQVALIGTSEDDVILAPIYAEARALLAEADKEAL